MRRRRTRNSLLNDSLDMLLDTITNTFGGILLITMLLVLQVRKTPVNESGPDDEERISLEAAETAKAQIAALQSKRESLQNSLELQATMLTQFADPVKQALAGELSTLVGRINQLRQEAVELNASLDAIAAQSQNMDREKRSTEQQQLALRSKLSTAQSELEAERKLRTRTMELPKEQLTRKDLNPVFLTDDGFYVVDKGGGVGLRLNAAQFQKGNLLAADIVWDGEPYLIRSGTGYPAERETIRRALSGSPPDDSFLLICCRTTGFEQFAKYKEIFVELGYEYRLVPGNDGISISYGRGKPQKAQ